MQLIQTRQHWFPLLLNIATTLLAWGAFAYLMVDGVHTLLQEGNRPKTIHIQGQFFATLGSLFWYLVMGALLSAALVGWAKYNQRRAGRYSRRKRASNVSNAELSASFGVCEEALDRMQQEQVLVLFNDNSGHLAEAAFGQQRQQKIDIRAAEEPQTEKEPLAA